MFFRILQATASHLQAIASTPLQATRRKPLQVATASLRMDSPTSPSHGVITPQFSAEVDDSLVRGVAANKRISEGCRPTFAPLFLFTVP